MKFTNTIFEKRPALNRLLRVGLLLIFVMLFSFCSKQENIVAEFANQKITLQEFKTAYINVVKQPTVFDSQELREKFLDEMISRKLLSKQARQNGMDKDEKFRMRIKAYEGKCLRDEHFKQVIKPKIEIDNKQIEEVFAYTRQQRRIKHLFVETKEQADSLYQLLEKGAVFDDLAIMIFADEKLAESGGDLGWVYWDQMEYDLGMTAFRQKLNTYSKPVKSSWGYHIIMPVNSKIDPLITEREMKLQRDNIRSMLSFKIGDKIAAEYISDMMEQVEIQVRTAEMRFVRDKLKNIFTRQPVQFDGMREMQITDKELNKVEENLWDRRNEVLAIIDGRNMTIADFINHLAYVPYIAVYQGYKTAFDHTIRDFVLTNEAISMKLDKKSESVKIKKEIFEDYQLQIAIKRNIVKNIRVTNDEVRTKYEKNKETLYQGADFEQAREILREEILRNKRSRKVPQFLDELKKDLEIEKNVELIHNYYDTILKTN